MPHQFIFLYPIKPYFEGLIGWKGSYSRFQNYTLNNISNMIDRRYRKKGFEINWVFFSGRKRAIPDLSMNQGIISTRNHDKMISNGVDFSDYINNKISPSNDYILDQLSPHSTLVIAGFHQDDCVDKLAEASYKRGINVKVDEDLTDKGINRILICRDVPIVRRNLVLEDIYSNISGVQRDIFLAGRKGKPWLLQPTEPSKNLEESKCPSYH